MEQNETNEKNADGILTRKNLVKARNGEGKSAIGTNGNTVVKQNTQNHETKVEDIQVVSNPK